MRANLACPIVKINYRLDNDHKYPTPVHDVLSGYDWIVENLFPKRAITRTGRSESVGRVAVCGELIGGGLATAVALTECRIGQPGVVAAAVNNPIVDWFALDEGTDAGAPKSHHPSPENKNNELESRTLSRLRTQIFTKPEKYFDPFASPILFFRSPGIEVPPAPEAISVDDLEQLSMHEREDYSRRELAINAREFYLEPPKVGEDGTLKKRKASRRFPGKALGLRLPQFYISTGMTSPLRDQVSELTHLLRQSFVRQSKYAAPGASDFGHKVLLEGEEDELDEDQKAALELQIAEAAKKAHFKINDGLGLWNDTLGGKARVLEVAKWFKDKLG